MIIYLIYMFITYIEGKILSFIFKSNYMLHYEELKKDLILYFGGKK